MTPVVHEDRFLLVGGWGHELWFIDYMVTDNYGESSRNTQSNKQFLVD